MTAARAAAAEARQSNDGDDCKHRGGLARQWHLARTRLPDRPYPAAAVKPTALAQQRAGDRRRLRAAACRTPIEQQMRLTPVTPALCAVAVAVAVAAAVGTQGEAVGSEKRLKLYVYAEGNLRNTSFLPVLMNWTAQAKDCGYDGMFCASTLPPPSPRSGKGSIMYCTMPCTVCMQRICGLTNARTFRYSRSAA